MKRLSLALLAVVLTIVLAACAPGSSLTLTLGSSSIDIVRGASGELEITVSGSSSGSVDLSIAGLPAGVTGSFDPATLAGGATSSTLTLDVDAGATAGTSDLTVTATQGGQSASSDVQVTVSDLMVTGRVVGLLDAPVAGVGVSIAGQVTTTDANGEFTIDGLAVPYDLVVYQAGADAFGHVFAGMTTASPEVLPFSALTTGAGSLPSGTLEGALPAPVPANHGVVACVEGVTLPVYGCDMLSPTDATHSTSATWASGTSATVRVRALELEVDADGFPVAYTGFGASSDVTVSDGGTTPAVDVTSYASAPSTTTLSGTASPPAGFTLESLMGASRVSANLTMPTFDVFDAGGLSTSFSVPMPNLGGGEFQLLARAGSASNSMSYAWAAGLDGSSAVSLPLVAPPALVSPADAATNVTTAETFMVAGGADALNTFVFQTSAVGEPDFAVTTASDVASIPDLAGVGLPLPAATAYNWVVIESGTVATTDEGGVAWLHDYYDAVLAFENGGPGPEADGAIATTDNRDFTTN